MNKTTHTIQDIEGLISEKFAILKGTGTREEKKKAREQLIMLEKHFNSINEKKINGHKYPEDVNGYNKLRSDKSMNKTEIYKLIDSVVTVDSDYWKNQQHYTETALDLSGVSVGKNRFIFIE